jgi:hypothetical protein
MKKKLLYSVMIFVLLTLISCRKDKVSIPIVATSEVTEISYRSATSGGSVKEDQNGKIASKGICWSTTPAPTIDDQETIVLGAGSFISNMTGLEPNTQYHVRAYAINTAGVGYGNEVTFITLPLSVPILKTTLTTSVTQKSAISGGTVTTDGGTDLTAKGICWSLAHNPTITDSKTSDGAGMDTFVSSLTGLTPGTIYYLRAYAINANGVGYGDEQTLTTSQVSASLLTGLIAYYPFNGNADDISGNGNNGQVSGATLTSDIFNHSKSAYYFNGSSYISLKPGSNFCNLNTYSISLWVKPTVIIYNGGEMVYCLGSDVLGPVQGLTYQTTGTLFAGSYNAGTNPKQSYSKSCCYDIMEWYHVVVTRNNSNINLFINGTLITSQATSAINDQNADYGPGPYRAMLGGRSSLDYDYFFTGVIDEVRIYNRVLTNAEITELKSLNE